MTRKITAVVCIYIITSLQIIAQTISFSSSNLGGENLSNPTSLQFGPDGRLYVSQQNGLILAYTVVRNGANNYQVTATETINLIQQIPNHDDNGNINNSVNTRQVTGILVLGTAANPVLYVTSSDPRIGGNSAGTDTNLDTNSGVISRLTKNGNSWTKVDLVRGLPRSEENHSINGLAYEASSNSLYMAQGGNTNMGAPSNNFAYTPEYAYSTAILKINLTAIGNTTYNLPTLDDETRSNVGGAQPGYVDANDPFGGNNGKNQAMLVSNGPVQVYSPGWRNNYDVLITQAGRMYSFDNGPNSGWGGAPTNCSNTPVEPGIADCDVLHYVTQGYYAGHANPTRGSRNNTFNTSNPQTPVPVGMQNPVECTYQAPKNQPGAIQRICTSTNGLAEYTASNFSNAMKGSLLATGFNGKIYRFKLNAAGTALASGGYTTLASGLGSNPLDITAQSDNAIFPGTIWICTYGSNNIAVLEPVDFVVCSGDFNSYVLDFDNDGYSNGDEKDNGTDPCSAASKPADFDNDKISNLNDPDDDNDGINDMTDKFAQDAANGTTTTIPVSYVFDNSVQPGINGWGFTGLMTNGASNYESLYDADQMTVGGAAYKFTVDNVPAGDAYNNNNNQKYAFQFGVKVSTLQSFYVHTRITGPFGGFTPVNSQSMGMFIGTGDQDNYLKIVTSANGGAGGIEVLKEVSASSATTMYNISILNKTYVDLYFYVDRTTNLVQPKYSIQGGTQTNLGPPLTIPAGWVSNVLAVGFISTSINSGQTFPATWDLIEVKSTQTPASDCNGVAGGSALPDGCGICSGGNTGHVANSDKDACGVCFGNGSSCGGGCQTNEVVSFTLMKEGTAGEIGPMTNGITINLASIGAFSVRANVCNQPVGSVKFILNGQTIKVESVAPYAINGDNPAGSYIAWQPSTGSYTLTATPYSGGGATGTAGISETISLTVINRLIPVDCNNVEEGTAVLDDCGVCSGGNTGHVANSDKDVCGVCFGSGAPCSTLDCNGVLGGTALPDDCGICSGGNTGHIANSDKDACGVCFGNGSTCIPDCNGVLGGTAFLDNCLICSGGNTGHIANSNKDVCGVCFGNGSSCTGPCVANEVVSFTLMKAGTVGEIGPLTTGTTINLATIGSFSVRVNTCNGQNVGSVKFILNGQTFRIETTPPYALNGDNNGNYYAWQPNTGSYTLTATPYSGGGGSGSSGISETVTFTVVNQSGGGGTPDCNGVPSGSAFMDGCGVCSGGNTGHTANSDKDACGVCFGNASSCGGPCQLLEVTALTLVREGTAGDIGPLTEGMTIYLSSIGNFSVRADVCTNTSVKSVKFFLNGANVKTESTAPYALNGDSPTGNYSKWSPSAGSYTLIATPYSGPGGSGTAGISLTRHFTVVNGSAKTELESELQFMVEDRLSIYPNPNSGTFNLEMEVLEQNDLDIRIYNQLGQVIYSDTKFQYVGELKEQLSLNEQASGIYFLRLTSGGKVFNEKIVVRK